MNLGRFARGYRGGATLRPVRQLRSQAYPEYAGVPPDTDGSIGDKAIDTTTKIVYKKRWVANREGAGDSILFPINLFPSVGDFDFSVRVRRDSVPNGRFVVCSSNPTIFRTADMAIDTGVNYHNCFLRNGTNSVGQYNAVSSATDTAWHTLGAKRIGTVLQVSVDGVVTGTVANTDAWVPSLTQTGTQCLFTQNTLSLSIKCCDLRLTGPGGSIIAPLDEGTGTVITNQAGANGTLTDGSPTNFWYAAWVPLRQGF